MNPLINPFISIPLLKNYFSDQTRLKNLNSTKLKKYMDKSLRMMVRYAYNVPLYRKKYDEVGLKPNDIAGIEDIKKIPFVDKQDLRDNFPDKIIPTNYNIKKGHVICTGGTTGKPVSIYTDFQTWLRSNGPSLFQLRYFNLNWRKSRIVHIGNFSNYRADRVFLENFSPKLNFLQSTNNMLNIDVNEPIKSIMAKLDDFKPDLIVSYPAIFQYLAFLKKKGKGENVKPKLMQTGGAILDDYTRSYVEDAFKCKLLNVYGSVEAHAPMAFECFERNWHIHADFYQIEAIDKDKKIVPPGQRGQIVISRLWGRGTPIIRYIGIEDWITLSADRKCSCGLNSPIFERPVEGRNRANIILPNGKIFPPGAFCFISPVLHDLKTYKVKQYQIIQRDIDKIEVLLVIDDDLRDVGAPFDKIAEEIKKVYVSKVGPGVDIVIKEVKEIKNKADSGKPPPIVVSYVKPDAGYDLVD